MTHQYSTRKAHELEQAHIWLLVTVLCISYLLRKGDAKPIQLAWNYCACTPVMLYICHSLPVHCDLWQWILLKPNSCDQLGALLEGLRRVLLFCVDALQTA